MRLVGPVRRRPTHRDCERSGAPARRGSGVAAAGDRLAVRARCNVDRRASDSNGLGARFARCYRTKLLAGRKADVDARFKKLGEDATAALSEVKDEASFKAIMPGFFKNCGGCHDKYRVKLKE